MIEWLTILRVDVRSDGRKAIKSGDDQVMYSQVTSVIALPKYTNNVTRSCTVATVL
jgi:hypothetical protein